MTTIKRRRKKTPLRLLELHRTIPGAPLLLMMLVVLLSNKRCCPLHHHTAAHAFSFGSPAPSSSSLAAYHHHPSACSVSRGSEAGCRASNQNGIPTTICFTANMDATSEEGLHYDTGSSSSSDSTFRDDGRSKDAGSKKVLRATAAVSSKGKDLRPVAQGKTLIGWEGHFQKLVQFKEVHGHCQVPHNYTVDDVSLGRWVSTQRLKYPKYLAGKDSQMPKELINQLNSIGFDWGIFMMEWKGAFEKLVHFKELHGHCRVPQNYAVDDVNLVSWVTTQRSNYWKYLGGKHSPMTQELIDQLNSIGFEWKLHTRIGWEVYFEKLVQFKESHGHCQVPSNYTVDNDVNLGNWVNNQRTQYKNFLAGKYSPMTQERIDALETLGFDWGAASIGWKGHLQKLVQFKELHGHCRVPINHCVDDVRLGKWVNNQRTEYQSFMDGQHSTMTQDCMDALNSIGFEWAKPRIGWEAHFQLLQDFQKEHGHCQVSRNHSVDNIKLGRWVSTQRTQYKNFLAGKYSPMTQEHIDALQTLGFVWKQRIGWEAHFRLLKEFQKEHGHCQVPRRHSVDNVNLGMWVGKQRFEYRKFQDGKPSQMTQDRINQLNAIGFMWKVL